MDILKMLADLRNELRELERAIKVLERFATGQRKRRGRPPQWMSQPQDGPRSQKDAPRERKVSPEAPKPKAATKRKWTAPARKIAE